MTREMGFEAPGFVLQDSPRIYSTSLPGPWLLKRATPSWRLDDPVKGFQRIVKEKRARQIALAVLDEQRSFPNAIVLATDIDHVPASDGSLTFPGDARFLVVDGQHRLWAQNFSSFEANYACIVHTGLSEVEMAKLFIEINENQKRVPASLRWDLVRLVKEGDVGTMAAAEMVYLLTTDQESPLFQRVDLTGEQPAIKLKQGSLAPGLKRFLTVKAPIPISGLGFEEQYSLVLQFLIALRDWQPDQWHDGSSPLYKARVLRALLRIAPELLVETGKAPADATSDDFLSLLLRVPEASLSDEAIRSAQGNAGIKEIAQQLRQHIFL